VQEDNINDITFGNRHAIAVRTISGMSSTRTHAQLELEASALEEARERVWQRKINNINSIKISLIIHAPSVTGFSHYLNV
jgi:hypothetical protein